MNTLFSHVDSGTGEITDFCVGICSLVKKIKLWPFIRRSKTGLSSYKFVWAGFQNQELYPNTAPTRIQILQRIPNGVRPDPFQEVNLFTRGIMGLVYQVSIVC